MRLLIKIYSLRSRIRRLLSKFWRLLSKFMNGENILQITLVFWK
jgi:hypothetical protein